MMGLGSLKLLRRIRGIIGQPCSNASRHNSRMDFTAVDENPFQPPTANQDIRGTHDAPSESPVTLLMIIALMMLGIIQMFVSIGIAVLGLLGGDGSAVACGLVSAGFQVAVLVGLIWRADWARMTLIWMCYVGIVVMLFALEDVPFLAVPWIVVNIMTLVIAHSPPVRNATRTASRAKAYTYIEPT